jgi:glycosyltransferase involved in cell wall biosynthesis
MSVRYVDKVYGVTPWRKEYAEIYFQIPPHKTDVLIMGADDDMVDLKNRDIIRENVRRELNMLQGERLVVTGGKIDKKKNIIALMEACTKIKNIKLLVFGNLLDDIREEFETLLKASSNIIYIGWVDSSDVYKYFFASDLVVFPGQHSVLWEQACAAKTPCLFKRWNGMEHVNNGGNSEFMDDVSAAGIGKIVQEILFSEKIEHMTKIASSSATDIFMYSEIAKKSVECFEETKV